MNAWKKVALVNGAGLAGIVVSLFTVSPNTPLWIWATASVLCLAVLNFFLFLRLRRGTGEHKPNPAMSVVAWLGVAVLLVELVIRYWHR
jgi:O-antigen/teichoic acid export membrane protein